MIFNCYRIWWELIFQKNGIIINSMKKIFYKLKGIIFSKKKTKTDFEVLKENKVILIGKKTITPQINVNIRSSLSKKTF